MGVPLVLVVALKKILVLLALMHFRLAAGLLMVNTPLTTSLVALKKNQACDLKAS
jgi:hypothetical protein